MRRTASLMMLLGLVFGVVGQPSTPYSPLSYHPGGIGFENWSAPYFGDIVPGVWTPNGIQGNDYVVFISFECPVSGLYVIELEYEFYNTPVPGGQVAIYAPSYPGEYLPLLPFSDTATAVYYTGSVYTPTGENVVIELPAGPILFGIDGFGHSQGKGHLRIHRAFENFLPALNNANPWRYP